MSGGNPTGGRGDAWRTRGRRAACALLAALALAPLPALAQQAQDHALMRSEILDAMIVQNEADLDFGDITPGTANGTVVLTPGTTGTAACTTNNGIVRIGNCRAARFSGSLPFLFGLEITKPTGNQVMLTGPGGATMRLRDFTFAKGLSPLLMWGGTPTEPNYFVIGGNFIVYVGGTLDVARNQRPGVYNGTFTLTFNYN